MTQAELRLNVVC